MQARNKLEYATFMQAALQQARTAKENGEVPIGAVVVFGGEIIAQGHNQTYSKCDPTGHAEIFVLRQAAKILKNARLTECDIYVTLEPCVMCAGAISHARIRRLYFGAEDKKGGAVENGVRFFHSETCLHSPQIYGGFEAAAAEKMLQEFFKNRR